MSYSNNRKRADEFNGQIEHLLQLIFGDIFEIADIHLDMNEGTDFISFLDKTHVSARVRDVKYRDFQDITIRAYVSSGRDTEIQKIGTGHYPPFIFYAYVDFASGSIAEWHLFKTDGLQEIIADRPMTINPDGRTGFVSVKFTRLPQICKSKI